METQKEKIKRLEMENGHLVRLLVGVEKKMGTRAHRLGCRCGGKHTEEELSCRELTDTVRSVVSRNIF